MASAPEATRPQASATVLLADDDEGLRRLMSQVLERNGYQVLEAESGERAEETLRRRRREGRPLVSDVVMGEMSGRELAAALQARSPGLAGAARLGHRGLDVVDDLIAGSRDFLAKPFKPSELIDKVHELLARRDGRRQRLEAPARTRSGSPRRARW